MSSLDCRALLYDRLHNLLGISPLNILYIVNDFSYFRAHREKLAKYMSGAGHIVTVASGEFDGKTPDDWDDKIELHKLSVDRHKLSLFRDMMMVWSLVKLIRNTNADIVHCFTIKPILVAGISCLVARNRKRSLIWTFAGLGKIFENGNSFAHNMRQNLVVMVLKFLTWGNSVQASFENSADRDRLVALGILTRDNSKVMMGTGIDLLHFRPIASAKVKPSSDLIFVMASRLIMSKGVDTFLSAARYHNQKNSPCRFVLAGLWDRSNSDSIDEQIIADAVKAGDIEFVGSVSQEEMPILLRRCDAFCLPTRLREGFPRSLLEAAACGLAMIATDQTPMRTLIRPAETGWLVQDGTVDGFYRAIDEAISQPEITRKFGRQARLLVEALPVEVLYVNREFAKLYGLPSDPLT